MRSRSPSATCRSWAIAILWVAVELLLDAVELMLYSQLPIPDVVQRALHRMAAPLSEQSPEMPEELAARARHLLAQVPLTQLADVTHLVSGEDKAPAGWEGAPWVQEFVAELEEERIRLHVVRLLQEAITLWPGEPVATRAAVRLAEEFTAALDVGDVATAVRLAPLVAAASDAEARQVASEIRRARRRAGLQGLRSQPPRRPDRGSGRAR